MVTVSRSETSALDARRAHRIAELRATDRQFRDTVPDAAVTAAIRRPGLSLGRIVATIMEGYADRPALGERARETSTDPATGRTTLRLLPAFETISYGELWSRAGAVATEWHHHPSSPVRPGEFVSVVGFTSTDYVTVELACLRLGAVSVPLHASASVDQLIPILAETGPRVLATSLERLTTAVACALASPSVRRLVVFDYQPAVDEHREQVEAARRRLADSPIALDALGDVLACGAGLPPRLPFDADPASDRLAMLIYTSGSTGTPKGAMYTDRMVIPAWRGFWPGTDELPIIGVHCLPMSHVSGRAAFSGTLAVGGIGYFTANSDLSTLFEDIALVRPTALRLVPRVCDMLFQRYHRELDQDASGDRVAAQARVREALRERFLGGRVVWAGTGSAPMSAEMAAFVESCVDLPLQDGFGSTEAGRIMVNGKVCRPPVRDYKLVDVPELGYARTDSPYPRGELLVKTDAIIPGYYQRPEATAEIFDHDGYYRTGDIMAEIGPDELVYLDRRTNVLKLSSGEFVSIARLEALFVTSPLVGQIFVYGNSERAYPLAVVVPTSAALDRVGDTVADLKPLIGESLRTIAKNANLPRHEIPRDYLIETEPFSTANGLLSDVRKLLRPKLKDRYGERLERMYAASADREAGELSALRRAGRNQPVAAAVLRAAQALLGGETGGLGADARFTDLGGDSLSALSLAGLLGEIFDVEVPVSVIINPANDFRQLARHIETALLGGPRQPTFASVHGAGSTRVRADDLTLEEFIDAATLDAAGALPTPSGATNTVLITGANGYLGRFLCLEWLTRTSGTVICLVRGATDAIARERLAAAFDRGDPDLVRHFDESAAGRLEVLAGDISAPGLGLDESTWHRLTDTVDLIVHPAALVNHVLPYPELFGPNVFGTAELIRMALTSRIKRISYVSTMGVVATATSSADEDADIRLTSPVRDLDGSYANGYSTSKWASEVLLRAAHEQFGLPVSVFRSDMILAHSSYSGQLNVPDVFTRLLLSLIVTGIAPRSFAAARDRARAHHGGLPVECTATAIAALSAPDTTGYRTFNVLDPRGVPLDVVVDWLIDAGHPITRIDDYDEWFTRFETAIRALPESRRRHSLHPLLQAFGNTRDTLDRAEFPTLRFETAMRAAGIGIPPLSGSLIRKYSTDLRRLRLI
ncbi:carboxylic acid reductase [Nocardia alba]|uniref:Carboxylic acid reductase n=1 Tax=Nocardia alba TaxID=225051 RepID=A0A4R1FWD7_9NOCA|nr:carboxylic acid reductase [Nocardia alba]TCJ96988.1 fatty acid CoA ligase FadD9 [Nocardia alba]